MIDEKKQNKKTVGVALTQQELSAVEELTNNLHLNTSAIVRLGLRSLQWAYCNGYLDTVLTFAMPQTRANTASSIEPPC